MYEQAMQAADLLEEPDPELEFALGIELGIAQHRAGQVVLASETLLKQALLAHHHQWWRRLAAAMLEVSKARSLTNIPHVSSIPLLQTAIDHTETRSTSARLLGARAIAERMQGHFEAARRSLDESIALARQCTDPAVLIHCLKNVAWIHEVAPEERAALLQEAAELAERAGDAEVMLDALTYQTFALAELGEIDTLEGRLQQVEDLVRIVRQPHHKNITMGIRVAVAILRGRWGEAVRIAGECVRQAPLQGVVGLEGRYGLQMFAVQRARGKLGEVAALASRIIGEAQPGGLWLPGQILLHCELGQIREAKQTLERLGDLNRLPVDDMYLFSLVYLADACVQLRDTARARWLFERLEAHRKENVSLDAVVMLGAVAGFMAPLAVLLRRHRAARALYEQAIEMNTRMGALPALARNLVEYAEWLMQRADPTDAKAAQRLLNQARTIAGELELAPVMARVQHLEQADGGGRLTARELAVLKMIAAGASNKQIARDLYVSHSTVATHVRNILRKTGAANRTEAAELARSTGLLIAD